ncbi:MAG TPA: hypothetical protein VNL73_05755 [Verrucomicrobiae bacterium]|nr:hypothetical protein [Verrucomicrobiae bacterium]
MKLLVPKLVEGILSVSFFLLALTSLSIAQQPVFGPPVNLGPRINTASHELDPFLTADGKKLFFSDGADIWFSEWLNNNWTQAVRLAPQINYGIHYQVSPSVSPDGQKLYYVDASRDGYYWDIWVSIWDSSTNNWGTAQHLDYPINTAGVEFSARIGPDGRKLYFSTSYCCDSLYPDGRCGFYVSEWNGSSWSLPEFLGGGQCEVSQYPSVTADLQELYYHQYVSDGGSIFVNCWEQSTWGPQIDLRPQLGGRTATPFITSTGDSLFFSACNDFPGFGGCDIWLATRMLSGDLNLDSQLTAADVVLELNKVFLEESYPAPPAAGEMTCDGNFTPADVVVLLLRVFGNIKSSTMLGD